MSVTIYHNPRCSKSRQTLALLEERGVEPEVVLYLETPPDASRLGDPEGATAWDDLPFAPYPFRSFSPIGVMAATGWKRLLDRTRG